MTYTTAHGNAGSLTHGAKPGIEPTSSWILVGFVSPEPGQEPNILLFCLFVCLVFCPFRAAPIAYGVSQARGQIGAVASGLGQRHSNMGSEPRLRPTPQLMATPDPQPTEQGQGSNPKLSGT